MNHWCEAGVVISRKVANLALFLGFRVDIGIGAPDKPEDGRHPPLGPERSEILAGRCWARLLYTICRKVAAKRIADSLGCLGIVHDKRITVQGRYLWLFGCAGSFGFRIDDTLDGRKHPFADGLVKRAHI